MFDWVLLAPSEYQKIIENMKHWFCQGLNS